MDHPLKKQELVEVQSRRPHILAVPFPAQGHVRPLMKLSQQIAKHGVKVTFVNTENVQAKLLAAMSEEDKEQINIELTSFPHGLMSVDDRNDCYTITERLRRTGNLLTLMEKINCDEKITCVVADITIGWDLDVAEKIGAEPVAFVPAAAAEMALVLQIPELIEVGVIDMNGTMMQDELILSDEIPSFRKNELPWSLPTDPDDQKLFFEFYRIAERSAPHAKWLLCNTFHEIESLACKLVENNKH